MPDDTARPLTAADREIARLQDAYKAALAVESAAYDLYIDLLFGAADYAAEQEWHARQADTKAAHEALLAAIDARRDGVLHDVIVAHGSPISNTSEARP